MCCWKNYFMLQITIGYFLHTFAYKLWIKPLFQFRPLEIIYYVYPNLFQWLKNASTIFNIRWWSKYGHMLNCWSIFYTKNLCCCTQGYKKFQNDESFGTYKMLWWAVCFISKIVRHSTFRFFLLSQKKNIFLPSHIQIDMIN